MSVFETVAFLASYSLLTVLPSAIFSERKTHEITLSATLAPVRAPLAQSLFKMEAIPQPMSAPTLLNAVLVSPVSSAGVPSAFLAGVPPHEISSSEALEMAARRRKDAFKANATECLLRKWSKEVNLAQRSDASQTCRG